MTALGRTTQAVTQDDCQRCGACCCNPLENRLEQYVDYIEITAGDRALLRRADLVRRYAVTNARGELHMRLQGDEQRCAALRGALASAVSCAIYEVRPSGCRRVEPGGRRCLQYRAERGIGVGH